MIYFTPRNHFLGISSYYSCYNTAYKRFLDVSNLGIAYQDDGFEVLFLWTFTTALIVFVGCCKRQFPSDQFL